jgi:phage baseplate assembly protein W
VYGKDFLRSPQGGLLLASDTQAEATSTLQRLQRLLFTNPRIRDAYGNCIVRGDSIFYPDYGVGVPALVDATMTTALLAQLQATILSQLSQDPGIVRNPAPVVTIASDGVQNLTISISVTTVSGQVVATPAYSLAGGSPS